jgi:ribosome-associated protein
MVKSVSVKEAASRVTPDDLTMQDVITLVTRAIEDKRGEQTLILDLSGQVDYLDYMIVCCGNTDVHNRAIADAVVEALSAYDIIPDALDGYRFGDWILLDYGVLVVHVFLPALRQFYRLEELWAAGLEVKLG